MKYSWLLLLWLSGQVIAGDLTGRVVDVIDGDTLTLLDNYNANFKVRLAAIDAPEKSQPFGNRGKQALSDICFGKQASVKVVDTDRYERSVGEISCNGVNANEAMVQKGMAWVYRKYSQGYGRLFPIEDEARAAKRGLWADASPVPPWEWRKAKRSQ